MRQFGRWIALALLLALGGCTSVGLLEKDVVAPTEKESVFIFGLDPEDIRLSLMHGSIDKNGFSPSQLSPIFTLKGIAKNGYVVGKANAGDIVGIIRMEVVKGESDLYGKGYVPCRGNKTLTFEVPAGKVIYIADLHYFKNGTRLGVNYRHHFDSAMRYIDENYPNLKGKVEVWPYQLTDSNMSCSSTVYIPIVIPGR